jgi:hypothetical protein
MTFWLPKGGRLRKGCSLSNYAPLGGSKAHFINPAVVGFYFTSLLEFCIIYSGTAHFNSEVRILKRRRSEQLKQAQTELGYI